MSASNKEHVGRPSTGPARKIVHLPTMDTYDRWATTYDTDGNILQALDTLALEQQMFPSLFAKLPSTMDKSSSGPSRSETLYITDLGCGTGRADLMLLSTLRSQDNDITKSLASHGYRKINLTGIDVSSGMLEVASSRVPSYENLNDDVSIHIHYASWDINNPEQKPRWLTGNDQSNIVPAHAIISTLVLEHLEIDIYFQNAKKLLRPGGLFLVTNMHSDMGTMVFGDPEQYKDHPLPTGAGFIDTATNTKFRAATDYAHTIEEVVSGAAKEGFELVDDRAEELKVEPWMLERGSADASRDDQSTPIVGVRGEKWIGTKCWYGMIFRLSN